MEPTDQEQPAIDELRRSGCIGPGSTETRRVRPEDRGGHVSFGTVKDKGDGPYEKGSIGVPWSTGQGVK